ncbi:ATPase, T2SS/T4P/T4SS family [Pseudobacteroides cellulosolvens]|uniref:Type II secretion system protein E n=1 Tax=Pseudobacteroides cellulosolvens ATCC 35603 = DSM 2933 TaxID=398512 RepID=A0A0L6JP08_9FIRM|nr:ATPase, T2SS/T4P/T4SS family [Pseudobacteroides cellulosolvens]KNY27513.1 type II secretion system protein E [Pseudobacteroides cellulosolvens ATCC 35603 = DSM 2933]
MLTRSIVSEKQMKSKFTNKSISSSALTVITFEESVKQCQSYINKVATNYYRQVEDVKEKRELTVKYIIDYVETEKPDVEGYNDLGTLREDLIEEITQYGPITDAMEDPEIDEVRANGPDQIFVEKHGKTEYWPKNFNDKEHMEKIITKLIRASKVRLTPKTPIVNARTIDGSRVNATHASISPYGNPAFVVRKFKKSSITPQEMLGYQSFSVNMLRLLSLIPKADLSWMTVGPTGSGKTTLNEMLVRQIDPLSRIITIENPSELRLLRYKNNDPLDKVINDVLQYESVSEDMDDASVATMENLLVNSMRQSPHWIGPGELRAPNEFTTALRAAQTGHYLFTTLHSEGDQEAIFRFLTAYLSASNEPAELALRNICAAIKFIIFVEKLADGSRKITSISEVRGAKGLMPEVHQIYKFECTDVEEDPHTNKVVRIIGKHKRVGTISKFLEEKMIKSGIKRSRFEFLTRPVTPNEEEEYDIDGILSDI